MKCRIIILLLFACLPIISGCCKLNKCESRKLPKSVKAFYTSRPVNIDGVLDEAIWKKSPFYELNLSRDKTDAVAKLHEKGRVQFSWDDNYFYVAAVFEDSDIIAEGKEDQMHHYRYGDLCELFLKPANEAYYWELYATPANKKTSFFFPDRSYLKNPEVFENYSCGLKVAANCEGTLNNKTDKDKKWTAEMAMPIKDLQAKGVKFNPETQWLVLIGRYNLSQYLPDRELSMMPQLSQTNYHTYEEYAELELVR